MLDPAALLLQCICRPAAATSCFPVLSAALTQSCHRWRALQLVFAVADLDFDCQRRRPRRTSAGEREGVNTPLRSKPGRAAPLVTPRHSPGHCTSVRAELGPVIIRASTRADEPLLPGRVLRQRAVEIRGRDKDSLLKSRGVTQISSGDVRTASLVAFLFSPRQGQLRSVAVLAAMGSLEAEDR